MRFIYFFASGILDAAARSLASIKISLNLLEEIKALETFSFKVLQEHCLFPFPVNMAAIKCSDKK